MGAMVQIQTVQAAIPQIQTIIHQATVSPIQSMSKWCGDRPPGGVAANESRPQPFMAYFLLLCCTLFSDNYYFSVYISTVTTIFSSQTKIRYLQSPPPLKYSSIDILIGIINEFKNTKKNI